MVDVEGVSSKTVTATVFDLLDEDSLCAILHPPRVLDGNRTCATDKCADMHVDKREDDVVDCCIHNRHCSCSY